MHVYIVLHDQYAHKTTVFLGEYIFTSTTNKTIGKLNGVLVGGILGSVFVAVLVTTGVLIVFILFKKGTFNITCIP